MNYIQRISLVLCLLLGVACSDSSDDHNSKSEAQRLLEQFGDLQRLGQRLQLPDGWSFHVIVLDEDAELPSVDGIAEVITDELGNTYQRIP